MQRLSADDYTWNLQAEEGEHKDYMRPVLVLVHKMSGSIAYKIELGDGSNGGDFMQIAQCFAYAEFLHNLNLSPDQRQRRLQAVRKALGFSYP